jgi:hypothetical protein
MADREVRSPNTVRGNSFSFERPGTSPNGRRADSNHLLRHVGKQSAAPEILRRKPPPAAGQPQGVFPDRRRF